MHAIGAVRIARVLVRDADRTQRRHTYVPRLKTSSCDQFNSRTCCTSVPCVPRRHVVTQHTKADSWPSEARGAGDIPACNNTASGLCDQHTGPALCAAETGAVLVRQLARPLIATDRPGPPRPDHRHGRAHRSCTPPPTCAAIVTVTDTESIRRTRPGHETGPG